MITDYQELIQKTDYYYDLTFKIFNELKEIICPVNYFDLFLYINPEDCHNGVGFVLGDSLYGRVRINLFSILTKCNNIETQLVNTIVHELYHCNQITDFLRYEADKLYHDSIEVQVEYLTYNFIMSNLSMIQSNFGVSIDVSYLQEAVNNPYIKIIPFDPITDLLNCIKDALFGWSMNPLTSLEDIFINFVKDKSNVFVCLFIGSRSPSTDTFYDEFVIKENGVYLPVNKNVYEALYFQAVDNTKVDVSIRTIDATADQPYDVVGINIESLVTPMQRIKSVSV